MAFLYSIAIWPLPPRMIFWFGFAIYVFPISYIRSFPMLLSYVAFLYGLPTLLCCMSSLSEGLWVFPTWHHNFAVQRPYMAFSNSFHTRCSYSTFIYSRYGFFIQLSCTTFTMWLSSVTLHYITFSYDFPIEVFTLLLSYKGFSQRGFSMYYHITAALHGFSTQLSYLILLHACHSCEVLLYSFHIIWLSHTSLLV